MNPRRWSIVLFIVLAVLYFGALDRISLTDPDEVFYSQTAREMLQHGSCVTPFIFGAPQFEKPPLFYWLLMGPFKVLGSTPLAARAVPAFFGLLGIAATFYFCRRVFNQEIAWLAAIMLGTSALYLAMSKAVLTDVVLSVFMTIAFYGFYLWVIERRDRDLYVFAVAAALAVLTKGPVAIIVLFLAAVFFLALTKDFQGLRKFLIHPWVLVFCVVCVPWYAVIISRYGHAFINEFIIHDNLDRIRFAEHKNFDHWWFYPMVVTTGLFPWTFYLTMMGRWWKEYRREWLFFIIWFAVTFVVFQRAHSKLASYILPAMPAVILALAVSLSSLTRKSKRGTVLAVMYALLGLGFIVGPFFVPHKFASFVTIGALAGLRIFGVALIAGAVLLLQGKFLQAIAIQAAGISLMFLLVGSYIPPSIDAAVANAYIRDIIKEEHYEGQPVVTNKLYTRGIYFYTGATVVVMDHDKQPFWSPHPLEVISNEEEITGFFDGKDRVLCVLKDSYVQELDRIFKNKRADRVIARDGQKVVVMSEKIK